MTSATQEHENPHTFPQITAVIRQWGTWCRSEAGHAKGISSNHTRVVDPNVKPRNVQSIPASLQTWKPVPAHTNSPVGFSRLPVSNKTLVPRSYTCHRAFVLCRRKHKDLWRQESIWKPRGMFAVEQKWKFGHVKSERCYILVPVLCLSHS